METVRHLFVTYGLSVIGGIIILVVGWAVAAWSSQTLRKQLERRERLDQTLAGFFSSLLKYAILAVVFVAVLNQFGVATTSIIAALGAVALALGLALQGTLSHFAAGVMILLFRPFKVGQYVEVGGIGGTVKQVNLFATELATPDNVQILVPNARVWGGVVKNYSFHTTRRADFVLGIGYDDSIDKAIKTVQGVIAKDERIQHEPEPMVVVGNLGECSVDLTIRVWCAAADYWQLKWDLTKAFKEALDKAGITIPYPQTDVHLIQEKAA
jgi:small conductance mechanosensitive channel